MASGHPDYQTLAGPSIGGSKVNCYSFSGAISAGDTAYVDIDTVPDGEQHSFVKIHIGCDYDDAIHDVSLKRLSDDWGFFVGKLIGSDEFDLIVDPQDAGTSVRLIVTNNSASTRTFKGSVSWVVREI